MIISLFRFLFKLLVILVALYAAGRLYVVTTDSMLTGERLPYVQNVTQNSAVIRWLTRDQQMGVVRYGEDPDASLFMEIEGSPRYDHRVVLQDLEPGTRYYYQAGDINGYFVDHIDRYWFETAPAKQTPTRIWAIGDHGEPGKVANDVRDSAFAWMKQNPLEGKDASLVDVWLSMGDIAYRSGTNDQFQKALFGTYAELTANTPLWPVPGNHDLRRWTYFRIFDLPENGEAGGVASGTEHYYSFNYSNIHFIMLDSESSERGVDDDMMQWLKRDLHQNIMPWTIAVFHHPPFTRGSHNSDSWYDSRGRMQDMRENFLPVLEQAGVDLVLSGHSHMYERSYMIDCYYGKSDAFSWQRIVSPGTDGKHWDYIKPKAGNPRAEKTHAGKVQAGKTQAGKAQADKALAGKSQSKPHTAKAIIPHGDKHSAKATTAANYFKQPGRQGTIYIVAGSSSKVDQGPLDHPAHVVSLQEAGSVVIDVDGDELVARFINDKGKVRDGFRISKQVGHDNGYKGCAEGHEQPVSELTKENGETGSKGDSATVKPPILNGEPAQTRDDKQSSAKPSLPSQTGQEKSGQEKSGQQQPGEDKPGENKSGQDKSGLDKPGQNKQRSPDSENKEAGSHDRPLPTLNVPTRDMPTRDMPIV